MSLITFGGGGSRPHGSPQATCLADNVSGNICRVILVFENSVFYFCKFQHRQTQFVTIVQCILCYRTTVRTLQPYSSAGWRRFLSVLNVLWFLVTRIYQSYNQSVRQSVLDEYKLNFVYLYRLITADADVCRVFNLTASSQLNLAI